EAPGAVVGGFIEPPADKGDGAPRVERATFDRLLVAHARFVQRHLEPPASLIVAPHPCVRGPVQQREIRRLLELSRLPRAEVRDDVGVAPGRSELLGLVDYD